jgi:hypothetical protein
MALDAFVDSGPFDESGICTIREVRGPQSTSLAEEQCLFLVVTDGKNLEKTPLVPYSRDAWTNSNLGRSVGAFGLYTDKWIGKRIRVTVGRDAGVRIDPGVTGR